MKKHPFLLVDIHTTAKISSSDKRQLQSYLLWAGEVLNYLFNERIISARPQSIYVSLLICGDAKIRSLNALHRKKDKITDVLSFPNYENFKNISGPVLNLGDLAICHPQTQRQAKEYKISYWDEFIHLFFHGIIHLLGYDHERGKKEEMIMQKWEDLALERFSEIKKKAKKKGP